MRKGSKHFFSQVIIIFMVLSLCFPYGFATPAEAAFLTGGNLPNQFANNGSSIYYNSGNLGVGTSNPLSTLQVQGAASLGGDVTDSSMRHFISWTSATPPGTSSTGSQISDNTANPYGWHSSPSNSSPATPDYGGIDLGAGNEKIVKRLRLQAHANPCKDFVLQGSNDSTTGIDGSWTDLLSSTMTTRTEYAWQDFDFSNSTVYRWYRLKVTSQYTTGWALYEWELLEATTNGGILVNGNVVPITNLAGSLGTNAYRWNDLAANTANFTGNVGVGTISPGKKLDVAGDIRASGNVYLSANDFTRMTAWMNCVARGVTQGKTIALITWPQGGQTTTCDALCSTAVGPNGTMGYVCMGGGFFGYSPTQNDANQGSMGERLIWGGCADQRGPSASYGFSASMGMYMTGSDGTGTGHVCCCGQ